MCTCGGGGGITCAQSFKILQVSEIDSAKGSVCMHFLLVAHWIDEGLEGVDPREVDWSKAFSPNLQLQDDLSVETLHEEMHLSHTSHGPLVAFTRRYVCRAQSRNASS